MPVHSRIRAIEVHVLTAEEATVMILRVEVSGSD
jgi:hypothetical protein